MAGVASSDTGFPSELPLPNLDILRHDVTRDEFPEGSFDLVHVRAVLMHLPDRMAVLRRMVSRLAPGGWLLAEDCDFGMWLADFDAVWAAHPGAWHEARLSDPDFLGCGFAFIGAWGRRPAGPPG
jgi:SAM-dependent methyltransferase